MSRHVIITGTGRSGTTFLVQLLTKIGVDTGFTFEDEPNRLPLTVPANNTARAGAELALAPGAPYVIKSPFLCFQLAGILRTCPQLQVDYAIVPMRDLEDAAESRRRIQAIAGEEAPPGGLWGVSEGDKQEEALMDAVYQLMRTLAVYEIPVVLLDFPRLVTEPDYLYAKLYPVFGFNKQVFMEAFEETSLSELVHDFGVEDAHDPSGDT